MGIIETITMLAREEALEEGLEKGIEQKSVEVVKKMLMTEKFTDAEIANFATVTEEFVSKVKRDSGM